MVAHKPKLDCTQTPLVIAQWREQTCFDQMSHSAAVFQTRRSKCVVRSKVWTLRKAGGSTWCMGFYGGPEWTVKWTISRIFKAAHPSICSSAPVEEVASASGQLLRVFSRSYNTVPETNWKTCLIISLNSMKEGRKWRRRWVDFHHNCCETKWEKKQTFVLS